MAVGYMAGQLVFLAVVGGVIWAVVVTRKPRPPIEDHNDEGDEW